MRSLIREQNSSAEIDKHFNCCICLEIVHDPTKCVECETVFCAACAHSQQVQSDSCPQCRCAPLALTQLNRYEKDTLESLRFDCPRCDDAVPFKESCSHIGKCWAQIECCPVACGVKDLQTAAQFEEHLTSCKNLLRRCTCCPVKGDIAILRDARYGCPS